MKPKLNNIISKALCIYATCICLFLGCEDDNDSSQNVQETANRTIILNENNNETIQKLNKGDTLIIELFTNPSLGHRWVSESYNTSILRLDKTDIRIDPAHDDLDGMGGTKIYKFEAIEHGRTFLEITSERATQSSLLDEFKIGIIVK